MAQLDIEPKEAEALKGAVDCYLSDLKTEIAHTDKREFREELKNQKELLEKISLKLNRVLSD